MLYAFVAMVLILGALTTWYCYLKWQYDQLYLAGRLTRYMDKPKSAIGMVRENAFAVVVTSLLYAAEPVAGVIGISFIALCVGLTALSIRYYARSTRP